MEISSNFTPWKSLLGGVIIGGAASLNLLTNGRITGASGIISGVLKGASDWPWRAAFLASLGIGATATAVVLPATYGSSPSYGIGTSLGAGVLVGFGSQLGSGCTSGHGVCGLPRLSLRSLTAVVTFMVTGALTSTLSYNPGIAQPGEGWMLGQGFAGPALKLLAVCVAVEIAVLLKTAMSTASPVDAQAAEIPPDASAAKEDSTASILSASASGLLFSLGLALSGMCDPAKVKGFLDPLHGWDPSLAFVMGGAVLFNLGTFSAILSRPRPLLKPTFSVPTKKEITAELVIGSAIFGIGWGLCGYCPAPAVMSIATGRPALLVWVVGLAVGQLSFSLYKAITS